MSPLPSSLPQCTSFLLSDSTPSLSQVRLFHRLIQQDIYERQRLIQCQAEILGQIRTEKSLRSGIIAFAIGFYADAEELLSDEGSLLAHAIIGCIYIELDDFDSAIESFALAQALPEAQRACIRASIDNGKIEDARTLIEQLPVSSKDSESAENEYFAGCIANIEGATEKAIHAFEAALDLDPAHVEAAFQLGSLLDRIGDEEMAIESYAICANTYPHYLPAVINLGLLYEERGEANAAVDCFRQVLAYNPSNPRALLLLRDATASCTMYYNENEERNNQRMEKMLRTPVNDFELSVRSRNSLLKMNIFNIGDLISITKSEMLNYKNFGETSLKEIEEMLQKIGLHLGQLREGESRDTRKPEVKILAEKISKFELSDETLAVLKGLGVSIIGDIQQYNDCALYRLPGSGQNVVQELFTAMASVGVSIEKPEFNSQSAQVSL